MKNKGRGRYVDSDWKEGSQQWKRGKPRMGEMQRKGCNGSMCMEVRFISLSLTRECAC